MAALVDRVTECFHSINHSILVFSLVGNRDEFVHHITKFLKTIGTLAPCGTIRIIVEAGTNFDRATISNTHEDSIVGRVPITDCDLRSISFCLVTVRHIVSPFRLFLALVYWPASLSLVTVYLSTPKYGSAKIVKSRRKSKEK